MTRRPYQILMELAKGGIKPPITNRLLAIFKIGEEILSFENWEFEKC